MHRRKSGVRGSGVCGREFEVGRSWVGSRRSGVGDGEPYVGSRRWGAWCRESLVGSRSWGAWDRKLEVGSLRSGAWGQGQGQGWGWCWVNIIKPLLMTKISTTIWRQFLPTYYGIFAFNCVKITNILKLISSPGPPDKHEIITCFQNNFIN